MKRILLLVYSVLTLGFSGISFAQTELERERITRAYDYNKASRLSEQIKTTTESKYNQAKQIAKQTNQALVIHLKDGGYAELREVATDGTLLYVRTFNKTGLSVINADALHTGGETGLNLDGTDMYVGVWDGGMIRASHELFGARAIPSDRNKEINNHATHVTGTIIGSAAFINGNAKGVAHKATARTYDWNDDYYEMSLEARNGMLLSNHSYGIAAITEDNKAQLPAYYFGQYIEGSKAIDEIAHTFDHYLIVFAAGNDRADYGIINPTKKGYDILTSEAVAKNNLVVAAISSRVGTGLMDSPISEYSNYGPTDDGRIKPDIAAKGDRIRSAFSNTDTSYGYMSGTSMATPFVTGGLVLLQEHAKNTLGSYLRSASMRALVLHSAIKAGVEGSPNYRYGWGVMNTEKAANILSKNKKGHLIKDIRLEQGDVFLMSITASQSEDLVGTIAWTDLAGEVAEDIKFNLDNRSPLLVHDLDLRIAKVDGKTYFPFVLNPDIPDLAATTGDNFRDNVEKVEVLDASGIYNLTISHKGDLKTDFQRVGLVLSGITDLPLSLETLENNRWVCENTNQLSIKILVHAEKDLEKTLLSLEKIPTGVKASIDTSSLASGVAYLNLEGLSNLQAGAYSIQVNAKNAGDEAILVPSFKIETFFGEAVQLLEPKNKQEEVVGSVVLSWKPIASSKPASYTLEIASDKDFEQVLELVQNIRNTDYSFSKVQAGNDYYWRVKAIGDCGEGVYSDVFVFHSYNTLSVKQPKEEKFIIHPNPSEGMLFIHTLETVKQVRILNMLGQEVMILKPDYNSAQVELDIRSLSSGSYLLQISDGINTEVKRLLRK